MPYVERTITGENEIIVTDSLESPLFDFLLSGNSEQIQDPPPSPENPQPIRGVGRYNDERDRFNSYFSIALKNAMLEDVSTEEKAVQSFKKLLAQKKDEGKQFKLLARISHPIKEELPEECQKAIEKLSTYDPTTVITVDGGEIPIGIKITYKAKEAKAWKFFI